MKKGLLFALVTFMTLCAYTQEYEIKLKIHGVKDSVVYLGHHFGEKKLVVDTARINSNGEAVFSGNKKLAKGIYLIVMPSRNMTYFEILIGEQQKFSVETDTTNFVKTMKIKGSKENIAFNQYQNLMSEIQNQRFELDKKYEAAKDNTEEQQRIIEIMTEQYNERKKITENFITQNAGSYFSKILLMMKEVEIPEAPKDSTGNPIEPDFQYKYYKAHYWDFVDWGESGLLRTPIFEPKLDYYFEKMVVPLPDSLIPEADRIITKAYESGDSLMFQYTASHLLYYFESSEIMGYDAIFVDIAEKWYLSGKAFWADTAFMNKLRPAVEKQSVTLIGYPAIDLKRMQTVDEKYMSLYQVDADYTILVFYEPSCGHCKKEVPALMQQYRDSLKVMNVKVFAVYDQYDRAEWEEFIKNKDLNEEGWINVWDGPYPHSGFRKSYNIVTTPSLFILDRNKKIIAKRLSVESIKGFLDYENGLEKK